MGKMLVFSISLLPTHTKLNVIPISKSVYKIVGDKGTIINNSILFDKFLSPPAPDGHA